MESSSRREGVVAAISRVKLQNPFVLRVGQVMTGFGVGCGLGIGVGVPIPMDIPGVAQVMSATNGMTRHIGGGRQLQGVNASVSDKASGHQEPRGGDWMWSGVRPWFRHWNVNRASQGFLDVASLTAGTKLGCRLGTETRSCTITSPQCSAVTKKVVSGSDGQVQTEGLGVHGSQSKVLQPAFAPTPFSQLNNTPSLKSSESEVERLRTQNEILRTLVRHQEKIEELEHDNALLREELNNKGILAATTSGSQTSRNPNIELSSAKCFRCRMHSRRRT